MTFESRPGAVTGLPDDQLATAAVSLSVAELEWTPDVAPAVMDRISRDAVAYPEQFDRRPVPRSASTSPAAGRSAKRTMGRLAVFALLLLVIVVLVVFAATVNASSVEASDPADPYRHVVVLATAKAAHLPIDAMRGRLVALDVDGTGLSGVVDQGGSILFAVMEAS